MTIRLEVRALAYTLGIAEIINYSAGRQRLGIFGFSREVLMESCKRNVVCISLDFRLVPLTLKDENVAEVFQHLAIVEIVETCVILPAIIGNTPRWYSNLSFHQRGRSSWI